MFIGDVNNIYDSPSGCFVASFNYAYSNSIIWNKLYFQDMTMSCVFSKQNASGDTYSNGSSAGITPYLMDDNFNIVTSYTSTPRTDLQDVMVEFSNTGFSIVNNNALGGLYNYVAFYDYNLNDFIETIMYPRSSGQYPNVVTRSKIVNVSSNSTKEHVIRADLLSSRYTLKNY